MKYFSILFLSAVVLTVPFCNFGHENQNRDAPQRKTTLYLDSVQVFHLRKTVFIPVEGVLEPWKQIKLFLPDSARLISLLAEDGARVKKGDLLASLWRLNRGVENTPVDLTAPISGRVEQVYFRLNQLVPASRPVISLINTEQLLFRYPLKPAYADWIRKGMRVTLKVRGEERRAIVKKVDLQKKRVEIGLYNGDASIPPYSFARGRINCGMQQGDFLKARYFFNEDSLKVLLRDSITLTLYPGGASDSLVQIYPALPGQDFIRIYQKNLDL